VTATLRDRAAIVGIGATEFSKNSGRTELQLAAECTKAALDDAGLSPTDVDGMVTFSMDSSDEIEVARTVGIRDLRLLSRIPHGGGAACGIVHQAAMAVATGTADVVVCYRALNGRSGLRFGGDWASQGPVTADLIHWSWYLPYGLMTPASWVAMVTQRYMHEFGATSEDLGRVSVATRTYAATNPAAYFYGKPITLEDHQSSRPIVDPSQGAGYDQEAMTGFSRDDLTDVSEIRITADQLWETSGIGPEDIQAAVIYDAFTAIVLFQLEAFGFCKRGEAAAFVADGSLEIDGRLPVNTHGGQLGEAYIHGVNGVSEGVRQIRGTSPNPVEGVEHVLVTSGVGVPSSGLVLGRA
jgi:acetyl-CoA acetyltransferase